MMERSRMDAVSGSWSESRRGTGLRRRYVAPASHLREGALRPGEGSHMPDG